MYHTLNKILSDIRIEQAEQLRQRELSQRSSDPVEQRLGLWLIARGESLAKSRPKAA